VPDAPVVTISDPSDPREPGDVLRSGPERPPRRLPRALVLASSGALVLTGAAYAVTSHVRAQHAQARARAAAFAVADQVGLRTAPASLDAAVARPGVLTVTTAVPFLGPDLDLRSLTIRGTHLTALPTAPVPLFENAQLSVDGQVDCAAVRRGDYPSDVGMTLVVVPVSGREHRVEVDAPADEVRTDALRACGLPDPLARTTAVLTVQGGQLHLDVGSIENGATGAVVHGLTLPGYRLLSPPLPWVVPPTTVFGAELVLGVTSCAAAAPSDVSLFSLDVTDEHGRGALQVVPVVGFGRAITAWFAQVYAKACPRR
jgi:hypothetical protein